MPIWYVDLRRTPPAAALPPARDGRKEDLRSVPPVVALLQGLIDDGLTDADGRKEILRYVRPGGGGPRPGPGEDAEFPALIAAVRADAAAIVVIDLTGHPTGRIESILRQAEGVDDSGRGRHPLDNQLLGTVREKTGRSPAGGAAPAAAGYDDLPVPDTAAQLAADPARMALGLTQWINQRAARPGGRPAGPRPVGLRQVALVVCGPPTGNTPWPSAPPAPGLCLETPERLNQALFREIYNLLTDLPDNDLPRSSLMASGRLRELPPSWWEAYSPQSVIIKNRYVGTAINDPARDFYTVTLDESFRGLVDRLGGGPGGPGGPGRAADWRPVVQIPEKLVYLLRLCRKIATQALENQPFECTVVIVPSRESLRPSGGGPGAAGAAPGPPGVPAYHECAITDWCRRCVQFLNQPPGFMFTDQAVMDHLELIQSDGLVVLVDLQSLQMIAVAAHNHQEDLYRGMYCRRLAREFGGVVAHMRGGRQVEVYDHERLQLQYDGFSWRARPYDPVMKYLKAFFHETDLAAERTGRALGAMVELLDARVSSIIGFINTPPLTPDGPALELTLPRPPNALAAVTSMRETIGSLLIQGGAGRPVPIKSIKLSALVGLLQLDGAHLINQDGDLVLIAQEVVTGAATRAPIMVAAAGTGRGAAKRLSAHIPYLPGQAGFVVKVSAAGVLHIYVEGREVHQYYPPAAPPQPAGPAPPAAAPTPPVGVGPGAA